MSYLDFLLRNDWFFVNFLQIIFTLSSFGTYVPSNEAVLIKRLVNNEICWKIGDDQFSVHIEKATISTINKLLISKDIDVYGISSVAISLEDRFLEITNKEVRESEGVMQWLL